MSLAKPSALPQRLLLIAALLWPAAAASQAGIFPLHLGDEAALRADLGTELRYDDNLFLTNLVREGDLIATASPGLTLDWGKTGRTQVRAESRMQFVQYLENRQESDSLLGLSVAARRDAARTQWSFTGSYNQIRANSRDLQSTDQLVRYDTAVARLHASHELSARMQLETGFAYTERSFADQRFISSRDVSVPLNLFRAWSPRIGGGLQYRLRHVSYTRRGADGLLEHSLGLGTRGDFTSTLSGHVGAGMAWRSGTAANAGESLRLDVSLAWRPDARTSCTLAVSSDTQPSNSTGLSYVNVHASLEASRAFTPKMSGSIRLSSQWADQGTREDEFVALGASMQWTLSEDLGLAGQIAREQNNSTLLFYHYTRTMLSCSATYRF